METSLFFGSMFTSLMIACGLGAGALAAVVLVFKRRQNAAAAFLRQLRLDHERPLLCEAPHGGRFRLSRIDVPHYTTDVWRPLVYVLTETALTLYEGAGRTTQSESFGLDGLRWYGRPQKYGANRSDMWLHFERDGAWYLLQIRLWQGDMAALVRALKQVTPPDLQTAYRRQRPYIHRGPVYARHADQDLYGVWTLGESLALYLMPLHLVELVEGTVQKMIPLQGVTHVASVQRLDAPGGVVRFRVEALTPQPPLPHGDGELAYAMDDYEGFAAALAEAAKRSLEAPLEVVERKGKKKKQ